MKIDRVTLLLLTMSILQQGYSICLVNKSLVAQVHPPPQLRYLQYHQKLRKFESCIFATYSGKLVKWYTRLIYAQLITKVSI